MALLPHPDGARERSHYQVAGPLVVGPAFGADFCTLLSSQGTCAHRPRSLDRRQGNLTNLRAAHTSVKRADRTRSVCGVEKCSNTRFVLAVRPQPTSFAALRRPRCNTRPASSA